MNDTTRTDEPRVPPKTAALERDAGSAASPAPFPLPVPVDEERARSLELAVAPELEPLGVPRGEVRRMANEFLALGQANKDPEAFLAWARVEVEREPRA